MKENNELSLEIKKEAKSLGFDDCGITSAQKLEKHAIYFNNWLNSGFQGEMTYMKRNQDKRLNPLCIIENGESVIVLLKNYNLDFNYPTKNKISKYAQGVDYHFLMKKKMNKLLRFIQAKDNTINGRCFVDSAPILEKAIANKAGLGWIGKNSMLINKKLGSFFFIGEIIIDKELNYDNTLEKDYCGNCTLCLDNCPTNAIISPKVIDSRKCISYLTIEYKNEFEKENKGQLNDWIFGCDICQSVCPWNKKSIISNESAFAKYKETLKMTKADWFNLSNNQFRKIFSDSPLQRAGLKQIQRNILANDD